MSSKRVNLVSLLALLFLVVVLAVTPEFRQLLARMAFWMEGVEEKIEASRRERKSAARQAEEESRAGEEEKSLPEVLPPHIVRGADGQFHPEPGYGWVDDDPDNLTVVWVPGMKHPDQTGVIASDEPDQWKTAPGYEWAQADGVNDMSALWKPGKPHEGYENVVAAEKQEEWSPAPGYKWLNDDPNDLRVVPAPPP